MRALAEFWTEYPIVPDFKGILPTASIRLNGTIKTIKLKFEIGAARINIIFLSPSPFRPCHIEMRKHKIRVPFLEKSVFQRVIGIQIIEIRILFTVAQSGLEFPQGAEKGDA